MSLGFVGNHGYEVEQASGSTGTENTSSQLFFHYYFPFIFLDFSEFFSSNFFEIFSRIKNTKKKVKLNLIKVIRFNGYDQATF